MMTQRARTGDLRPKLIEEADWLSDWASRVAPSYAPLGAKTIQNKLGALYRDLLTKRPSTAALPTHAEHQD